MAISAADLMGLGMPAAQAKYLADGIVFGDSAAGTAIADLAWTYTANDPGTTPNSLQTFADGTALVAATAYGALDEVEGKINAILAALRTAGIIST